MSQATIRSWDADAGATAFLDDGTVVEISREALQGSVFRFLRPGQRVRLERVEGRVVGVGLP